MILWTCDHCGKSARVADPARVRHNCSVPQLPLELAVTAKKAAESGEMLLGDMIAAMTKAVGIPPCGGCESRKKWLNRAHAWLRGEKLESGESPGG